MKKSKVPSILIGVAIVYTVCPDLVPGPIDDLIVDVICITISTIMSKAEQKAVSVVNNGVDRAAAGIAKKAEGTRYEQSLKSGAEKFSQATKVAASQAVNRAVNKAGESARVKAISSFGGEKVEKT